MTMPATLIAMVSMVFTTHSEKLQGLNLDKTGTSGLRKWVTLPETAEKQGPAKAGSFGAEGVGFEPTNTLRYLRFSRPVQSTALPSLRTTLRLE